LSDYKRGSYGNPRDMCAPFLDCLRIAEAEQHAVENYYDEQAMAEAAKRDDGPKR